MTKQVLPGTTSLVSLVVNTLELKEWIDKTINLSPETSNWSLAYNICRSFPGLHNAEKLAEFVLETSRQVQNETEEGKQIYAEIDADDIISIVCKIYNLARVAAE